jgi:ribosome-associated protein
MVEKINIDNIEELVKAIAGFAYEKKARDIVGIDLSGISPVTDYFVICSGSNKPQIKAISDNIEDKLSELGVEPNHIEGYQDACWILLDYGNIVIHVFDDENREYYNLERLWGDAPAYSFNPVDED